jgi:hypothetical protein
VKNVRDYGREDMQIAQQAMHELKLRKRKEHLELVLVFVLWALFSAVVITIASVLIRSYQ